MGLKGGNRPGRKLRALAGGAMERTVGRALFAGAEAVAVEAHNSIMRGSASGSSGGKHQHTPSAPGTPPNNMSGHLANQIEATHPEPLRAIVTADAEYSAIHEFGGTIRHPGGTPYFMRDGLAVFVSKSGQGAFHHLPVTKPHDIVMPARPFMRPARDRMKPEVKRLVDEAYAAFVRATMKQGGK